MSEPITSLDAIAREASAAAAKWDRAEQGAPEPANPYDEHLQPAHHAEWKKRFLLALLRQGRKEAA